MVYLVSIQDQWNQWEGRGAVLACLFPQQLTADPDAQRGWTTAPDLLPPITLSLSHLKSSTSHPPRSFYTLSLLHSQISQEFPPQDSLLLHHLSHSSAFRLKLHAH